jgi:hypothetical protein
LTGAGVFSCSEGPERKAACRALRRAAAAASQSRIEKQARSVETKAGLGLMENLGRSD